MQALAVKRTILGADKPVSKPFNVLVSSAGRRVVLIRHLRSALHDLGLEGQVFAADLSFASSACQAADRAFPAPLFSSGTFVDDMLRLCEREQISLIVPTIDTELMFYAENRQRFADLGTTLCVSSPQTIEIGADKAKTHAWMIEHGHPVPRQARIADVLASPGDWPTPLIVKPARGSSSVGLSRVKSHDELTLIDKPERMVVESMASGDEYTIDVYIDRTGRPRCSVPRKRLETRGGEVSKGMTVRHRKLQDLAEQIAAQLPGAFGVINIQIFYDEKTHAMAVIEINPRFGGGYPLTHEAGAHCTHWLIEDCLGREVSAKPDQWRDGLVMLRYDEAIYVDKQAIQNP